MPRNFFNLWGFCLLLAGCATTSFAPENITESAVWLQIESYTPLNRPADVQRQDFLIELTVKPAQIARAENSVVVDTDGPGGFKISKGDVYFAAGSEIYGDIYCGFGHLHVDSAKTTINQGCLADRSSNGVFDTYLVRTGSLDVNALGFLYYDANIAEVAAAPDGAGAAYSLSESGDKHAYEVAFMLDRITKRKDGKYAVFNIYTKTRSEARWSRFPVSKPVEVPVTSNAGVFVTPMFTARLTDVSNKSLTAEIMSVASEANFGFDRSSVNSKNFGYKPAYQISGDRK